jgi:hypothetical protein
MFSNIFGDVAGKYDHVAIASKEIQNKLVVTWILSVYRLRKDVKNKPRKQIDTSTPVLPPEVKQHIDIFLGDGLNLMPSLMPAKALKALTLQRRQARKMEMRLILRSFLHNLNVELMSLCNEGKLTGTIALPPELTHTVEEFDVSVRDGKNPYAVIIDAIEEQGYTILSTCCSCNGHANSVCAGSFLEAVNLSWE